MNRNDVLLKDDFIIVQPGTLIDVSEIFKAVKESLPELKPWLSWATTDYTREEALIYMQGQPARWEDGQSYEFAVKDLQNGQIVGGVGLNQINHLHRIANLGYWVRSSQAGRGIASRAARLVAQFGIQQLGLTRIEILAAVDNLASQKVALKAGATREALLRNRLVLQGKPTDAVMHSFIPQDFGL